MNDSFGDLFVNYLIILVISVALFLLIREIIMWYCKINKRIELAQKNNLLLEKLLDKFNNQNSDKNNVIPEETDENIEELNNNELIEKYGIVLENDQYIFGKHKYDKVEDAINYAKFLEEKQNEK